MFFVLSHSILLAVCRTRDTYELRIGPCSPNSLWLMVMHQSAVVSSSGEDFRISSLVPLFHRISFPNYLKPSTKSRFLQTFLFGRKMFKARHVIKILGYILKKLASQPCLRLSRRPVSTIKANSQTPHSPFSPN